MALSIKRASSRAPHNSSRGILTVLIGATFDFATRRVERGLPPSSLVTKYMLAV